MLPHERSLVKRLKDAPFALLGVNSDPDLQRLRPRLEAQDITWRSFWNGPGGTNGPISRAWGVQAWPQVYVIDASGRIRFSNLSGGALGPAVDYLLAEMQDEGASADE